MAKQLNINMAFTADTSQAKKQIADLQTQLSNLMTSSATNTTDSFNNSIQESIQSVAKLKMALSEATDTKTGIVDLSKFNQNLSDAGLSVEQLSTDMAALGPAGVQAFSNVASSIATMESPLKRTNQLLDSFWTALKNSARWQISSGVLHGLTSAVQGAYSYAQDLNKSLSNIAIVTGQNVSEMDAFAEKANKAAQALSVTTTAYTDASLIYYQQGLDADEVDERTQTTLKLSNVTGESVDEVSSYMTAIWNNFADGSDNLELFADKITALGAATASSSEEIAEGIEQFASLGSTMGLSYDNATAALATVVAQTRQSASTVGNSMRTILQRFQSLSLGETLEDGVDLTDYTSALKTVGVEVLDADGKLKDLDEIITDLGSAWQNLDDAQRSALAGTVAGVRNSNTLIAWMDNFDKFQENLEVAANAEGSLDEQAEIYAQSWEGAQKRVKAAWQAIYSDIIDDDFFITLNNVLEDVLQTVDRVIDGFGGLPALLTTVGTVFTSVFKDKISSGLSDMVYTISNMTPSGQKKQQKKDDEIRDE
jgi:TP901 family phage tail tape measure protein